MGRTEEKKKRIPGGGGGELKEEIGREDSAYVS